MNNNKKDKDPKEIWKKYRPMVWIAIITLIITIMLNSAMTRLVEGTMQKIQYSEFLYLLNSNQIESVVIDSENARLIITPTAQPNPMMKTTYYTIAASDLTLIQRLERAGVAFERKEPAKQSFLLSMLGYILPFIIIYGIFFFMMRGKGGMMGVGKSNAKMYVEKETGVTFKDVAGQDEAKESLQEVVDFLHNPKKYTEVGAKLPKGALLVGPPGTGKTLLAKAVAGEAKVPFFSVSGSEFVEMYVGVGASRVRDLFKQAKEKAPCIVFIDEIDAIGKRRDSGQFGGNDEREQTLNQLLSEMDGFDGSKGVVILAATNRPETLDKALLRPGRFDRRIPVELPDLQGREAILRVHAKNIKIADDVDFRELARATAGASGAELANIVNEAALRAVKMQRKVVEQADLEESIEVVIAGYQRKGAVISPEEKKVIAYHEIGHALVAAMQKHSAPVHKITIIPRTNGALGYTMQIAENDSVLMKKEELFNKIVTITGGRSAEEIAFGSITSGAANDIEQATRIARAMVTRLGMTEEFDMMATEVINNMYLGGDASLQCSAETAGKIDAKVLEIIKEAHAKARAILSDNRDKLDELANFLLEKETITGEEFMAVLNGDLKAEAIAEEEQA